MSETRKIAAILVSDVVRQLVLGKGFSFRDLGVQDLWGMAEPVRLWELSWERLDGKRACRIAYTTTAGGWKSDESKWPDIQDAMIDAMVRLEKALGPFLVKLKAELREA